MTVPLPALDCTSARPPAFAVPLDDRATHTKPALRQVLRVEARSRIADLDLDGAAVHARHPQPPPHLGGPRRCTLFIIACTAAEYSASACAEGMTRVSSERTRTANGACI